VPVLILVAAIARAQTLGNPVSGYDEQFYLLVGDRMLGGALPYVDIFDRKPIGLFLIYAFIRSLGGEGTLQYQFVAGAFAIATAAGIYRLARSIAPFGGALAAALLYLVWLDFMEGEGGQAPVFFNLPVIVAAALTMRGAANSERFHMAAACGAMIAVGIAIQIKYTAMFEGCYFGCVLMWAASRSGLRSIRLGALAVGLITIALAPTAMAWAAYAAMGHGSEFVFANFVSIFGRLPDPRETSALGLLTIMAIVAPIMICAFRMPPTDERPDVPRRAFILGWLVAALAGMLVMGSFPSPHYGLPLLAAATVAAAPRFGAPGWGRYAAWMLLGLGMIGAQICLHALKAAKGGAAEAAIVAAAATPRHGCLYVYDGYPALYRLTRSCLMSRFVFPGHLNMANEASAKALGVEPTREVARIMAARPEVVVDDYPAFERGNRAAHAIVLRELAAHYRLVLRLRTGADRFRLVYRRNPER
jgi:hypothetical protein